ncbi:MULTISPECIES: restriction endonuclease subunit S [unclassified Kaistella]|uniref:restriction endonuclease subunit S n=1 Tax=unclassified Kaistella TaxID=2762626 RepID=UPI002735C5AE|nr:MULTISPECIES: restriction endonuclease subunit S [unclassified Kaistella]MDP2455076.1 restriction endonuclease subunit S [Kaistella sp. SH11-4b]MDP2457984.1 restriction endonuclease subunit S [Kaistella sp. SH40-3]MDP2460872.1 restriction endonuclease subunit S [Kaistella sp. SH19-2b]
MKDWVECSLGEIFKTVTGNTPSKSEKDNYGSEIPFVKPPQIDNNYLRDSLEFLSPKGKAKARILPINSVLVTCIGNLGRIGLNKKEVAFNQQINAIEPLNGIEPKFTFYQAQSTNFRNQLERLSTSTTVALVNKSSFNSVKFKVAPTPIQKAIVKKIEELFSSLDSGIADLKKAQEQLVIYKQAVLKKAFEGELTKDWRAQQIDLPSAAKLLDQIKEERGKWIESEIENGNSEAKRIKIKLKKLVFSSSDEKLPKSWRWTNFISACVFVIDCHNKTAPYKEEGIYLIRTTNIRNGKLNLIDKIKYVSEETYNFWSKRVYPKSGDIVFTREAPMGEAAIIPKNIKVCLGQRTMILRTSQDLLENKYLLYNILSEVFQQKLRENAIGTGVKHLRVGDVETLSFPLCCKQEQHQIVNEIESRLSVCDKVEESLKESLEKAKALRQSILKKAFEGKLLSAEELAKCKADQDYEPASVLLEKIKKEKK